jgi:hypothetical protein
MTPYLDGVAIRMILGAIAVGEAAPTGSARRLAALGNLRLATHALASETPALAFARSHPAHA